MVDKFFTVDSSRHEIMFGSSSVNDSKTIDFVSTFSHFRKKPSFVKCESLAKVTLNSKNGKLER